MIQDRNSDSKIVAHARRELEMAGLFTKQEDYDGQLGRGSLALIKVFDQWAKGDGPIMQSLHQLFNGLVAGELLSPPTTDPDEWEDIKRDDQQVWRNKRSPFYVTTDHRFRTWTNLATQEKGACKNHVTGEIPNYEPPKEDTESKETRDSSASKTPDAGVSTDNGAGKETGNDEGSDSDSASQAGRRGNTGVDPESVAGAPESETPPAEPQAGETK